ncbi:MAG: ECF transporter S component [Clostridiales bacterium]|nr:ECF transporter S component [Clostridiales bacterium]
MSLQEKESRKIRTMILTALLMSLIMVLTFATKIPVPATQGYIHLGDCMIFMAVIILGRKYGTAAAALGSALADIVGGYAFYAPISFLVKGAMAFLLATFLSRALEKSRAHSMLLAAAGMVIAGMVMVAGYYAAETILYGNPVAPLAGVPMNILQFAAGIAVSLPLAGTLGKTVIGKDFAYRINADTNARRAVTESK